MLSIHMAFFLYPLYLHWYAAEFLGRGYLDPLPLMYWKKCILWLHSPSQIHLTFSFRSSNPSLICESLGLLWLLTCHHHSSHSQVLRMRLISLIWAPGSYMYVQQVRWCFPAACSWTVHLKITQLTQFLSLGWLLTLSTAHATLCTGNTIQLLGKQKFSHFWPFQVPTIPLKCWMCELCIVQVILGKKQHGKGLYFASESDRCIGLKLPKDNFRSTHRLRTWDSTSSTMTVQAKTMVR